LTRTAADAEDATQEIFLRIWRHANRFDCALGSETTFIAMISRRCLFDRLRKTMLDPLTDSSKEGLERVQCSRVTAEGSIDAAHALKAMASLRPECRQVLELGFLHELSHAEIARYLDIPLGTVKTHIRRGLMRVRACINGELMRSPRASSTPAAIGKKIRRFATAVFPEVVAVAPLKHHPVTYAEIRS
jgi:RNA polymerase sigma-70 factor (ECF subfamily)